MKLYRALGNKQVQWLSPLPLSNWRLLFLITLEQEFSAEKILLFVIIYNIRVSSDIAYVSRPLMRGQRQLPAMPVVERSYLVEIDEAATDAGLQPCLT